MNNPDRGSSSSRPSSSERTSEKDLFAALPFSPNFSRAPSNQKAPEVRLRLVWRCYRGIIVEWFAAAPAALSPKTRSRSTALAVYASLDPVDRSSGRARHPSNPPRWNGHRFSITAGDDSRSRWIQPPRLMPFRVPSRPAKSRTENRRPDRIGPRGARCCHADNWKYAAYFQSHT